MIGCQPVEMWRWWEKRKDAETGRLGVSMQMMTLECLVCSLAEYKKCLVMCGEASLLSNAFQTMSQKLLADHKNYITENRGKRLTLAERGRNRRFQN